MVKNQTNEKQLIVVAGVTGSGKSTFSSAFKNSFLRSLPLLSLDKGLASDSSFYVETNLSNASQFSYFEKAKDLGYKITVYYLFTGKQLSIARARLREAAGANILRKDSSKNPMRPLIKALPLCFRWRMSSFYCEIKRAWISSQLFSLLTETSTLFQKWLRD